ncbi:putative inner membrane protein [Salmonella enterica subsp. arizonae]|uniref:Putative inner membrane protein n=1 Tax=Salmonella enterica subsp. arizonae TaxID=59203 RepID=A0A2X4T728_SALER|nr:putative inner membrane protein [Salmonella enterica subsp. arizonae]SUG32514.1 putative inner membrane protein [Salmonella enterica subsp. arizonae]
MAFALRYNPVHIPIIPIPATPIDAPKTVKAVLYAAPLLTLATTAEHTPPKTPVADAVIPRHIKHLGLLP